MASILVVEDDEKVRQIVDKALNLDGHSVVLAATAEDGLRILQQAPERIDLVLTDVRLKSGMNGLEFRKRVLSDHPAIPVALMSGDTYGGQIPANLRTIRKPFTVVRLQQEIRGLLGKGFDPELLRREILATGERLLNAMRIEQEFSNLYAKHPQETVLEQWKTARKLVEMVQDEYDRCVQRYRLTLSKQEPE